MATIKLGSFEGDLVIFQADFHDGTRRITVVRCINNGTAKARGAVVDPDSNTVIAQVVFLPGTTQRNIPQGRTVTVDELGDPNFPYHIPLAYPVP